MFSKIIQKLYHKIFVNIIVHDHNSTVYIEVVNSKAKVLHSHEKDFQTSSLNKEMIAFIQKAIVESPYYYISLLDKSSNQGALPTINKKEYPRYIDDPSTYEIIPIDKRWSTYCDKGELYNIEQEYEKVPLDFIFSPFILLDKFFKDKLELNVTMFLLIEKNFISLSIYNQGHLLYADHLDLEHSKDSGALLNYEEDGGFDEDDGIDLDDISAIDEIENIDLFDDFGDIEDLDSIDDIDEFSESKDIEEELLDENIEEEVVHNEADGFNEDYQRFSLIQTSLNKFYKDDLYESEFVQTVYIADGIGLSYDLKRFLEEEMFLSVYTRKINLTLSLGELAKEEMGL
jgi:hypothetical protein